MKYMFLFTSLMASTTGFAAESQFCLGFEEGYKTIKGDMIIVPMCPMEPIIPIGSTPFREGIKAGLKAASR